mmetsp:Transcript_57954/g.180100  ORF Transcript_57954/g.180100 Transcript_57954/m.180100 type:complete len:220 (+) Transcript_57954:579-1238(+)
MEWCSPAQTPGKRTGADLCLASKRTRWSSRSTRRTGGCCGLSRRRPLCGTSWGRLSATAPSSSKTTRAGRTATGCATGSRSGGAAAWWAPGPTARRCWAPTAWSTPSTRSTWIRSAPTAPATCAPSGSLTASSSGTSRRPGPPTTCPRSARSRGGRASRSCSRSASRCSRGPPPTSTPSTRTRARCSGSSTAPPRRTYCRPATATRWPGSRGWRPALGS